MHLFVDFSPQVRFYYPTLHFISGRNAHIVTSQQVICCHTVVQLHCMYSVLVYTVSVKDLLSPPPPNFIVITPPPFIHVPELEIDSDSDEDVKA